MCRNYREIHRNIVFFCNLFAKNIEKTRTFFVIFFIYAL